MALSRQQIEEMDKITGLGNVSSLSRVNELKNLSNTQVQNEGISPFEQKANEGIEKYKQIPVVGGLVAGLANTGKFLTRSEQKFGKDIAQAGYLLFGGQKKIDETTAQYLDNGTKLTELAKKQTDPEIRQKYAQMAIEMYRDAQKVGGSIIGDVSTPEQIVGNALGVGLDVVSAGTFGKVAKTATGATGVVKGAIQGAKTGAIAGGAYGGAYGVTGALQENKSAGGVVLGGVTGAATGAVVGGTVGGVTGGISGGLKQREINILEKEKKYGQDLVMPKATDKVKQQALKEGRVTEQGLFKGSQILPSKRDERTYEAVKDIISSKNSATQNLNIIKENVQEINSGVKAYVGANKVPITQDEVVSYLNTGKDELNLIFASDKQAEKTYDAVVREFIKQIDEPTTYGVLNARQAVDKIPAIKKLLDSQGLGENAKKEIVLTLREMANKLVAEKLPAGNLYREALLRESNMLNAIGNIAAKKSKEIGVSRLMQLTKDYPILKWLVGGVATGIAGAAGVGVGGVILSSTD